VADDAPFTHGRDGRAALPPNPGPGGAALFIHQRLRLPELTSDALNLMVRRFLRGERRGRLRSRASHTTRLGPLPSHIS
jgi:hypothetical protein